MSSLSKTILLVAAAAAVTGPSTASAQRRGGGRAFLFSQEKSNDGALRSDSAAAVPGVASIVNGTSTGGPRPYMVGLGQSNDPFCGGSLINPYVVLTAAHCMYFPPGNWDPPTQVYVNLYDINDPAGVVTINIEDPSEGADIVVHPDFYDAGDYGFNDVALMFLPVGQVAEYAKLNDDPHEPVVHDSLRVMGWGRIESGDYSDVLLETTVNYISNEECKEAYADTDTPVITDGMMCAYKKFTAHCSGDSGGPLFHVDEDGEIGDQPTQVGIVSWSGRPCGTYPGVYTRVSYYSEWIKETVCSRPEHTTKELCGSSKSGKRA